MSESTQGTEQGLIEKIRKGDERAFATLLRIYNGKIYGFFYRTFRCPEIAKDLFQETFLRVWRNIGRFDANRRFDVWLFTIAHRVSIDAIRAKKTRSIVEAAEFEGIAGEDDPAQRFLKQELDDQIALAVEELSEKQRRVFLLRQQAGLAFKEIAEVLDEPLNTVLSHMHYAVKKLRKILQETYDAKP